MHRKHPPAMRVHFERAVRENKRVLLFVSSPTCHWCVKMKREIIPNLILDGYILVEVIDPIVYNSYGITGLPTFVIFEKSGVEVKRAVGYRADLQAWLK